MDEPEPDCFAGDETQGECPCCGAVLSYKDVIATADVCVDCCPECGWEGGIG